MNIDFRSTLIHQQQLQLHNHASQTSQQQDQQLLAQLLVGLILQQLESALKGPGGNNGNGNGGDAAGGAGNAGGSSGVGGAGGAQQADGAHGGQGIMGALTQFMELLKMLEQLFGDPAGKGANDTAQKLAQALGLQGPGGQGGGGSAGGAGAAGNTGGAGGAGPTGGAGGAGGSEGTGGTGGIDGTDGTGGTSTPPTPSTPGTSGTSGTSGTPGTPGTSATSGSTGTSGATGPAGIAEPSGEKVVNETIVVKAGEVFDGKNMHFKAGPALGDGGQGEDQKPIFKLEPGAQIKNVQLSGADGIHAYGDAKLDNVVWRDVGEDAFTLKAKGNVEVNGGGAFNANDKIFQLNAGGSFTLNNFTADTFGKAIRTNGGKEFPIDIEVNNSTFNNGKEAIVRTDATQANVKLSGVDFGNTPYDVIAPNSANVEGAKQRGSKAHTG